MWLVTRWGGMENPGPVKEQQVKIGDVRGTERHCLGKCNGMEGQGSTQMSMICQAEVPCGVFVDNAGM